MPRRKQDRPKRMKWEESSNDRAKDDDGNGDDILSLGPSSKDRTSDEEDSTANPDEDDDEVTEKRDDGGTKKKKDLSSIRFPNMQEVEGDEDDEDQVDDKTVHKVDIGDCDGDHPENTIAKEPLDGVVVEAGDCGLVPAGTRSPSPIIPASSPRSPVPISLLQAPLAPVPLASPVPVVVCTSSQIKEEDFEEDGEEMRLGERRLRNYNAVRMGQEAEDDEIEQDGPLDFSVKKSPTKEGDCDRLMRESMQLMAGEDMDESDDAPLDLSVSRKRPLKRAELQPFGALASQGAAQSHSHHRSKALRLDSASVSKTSGPWSTQFPFRFSPSASPNSGVEIPVWNGGVKSCHSTPASSPSPSSSSSSIAATAPGAASNTHPHSHSSSDVAHSQVHHQHHPHHHSHHHLPQSAPSPSAHRASTTSTSPCGRHNAWQSHWLSRGAEQAKDVLKCVWCRKSFRTLDEMTTHMKEARHCGMHLHQSSIPPPMPPQGAAHRSLMALSSNSSSATLNNINSASGHGQSSSPSGAGGKSSANSCPPDEQQQQGNLLMKESIPMPRKLVRGQDVWLGKGAEQTKQILKCMWCGQSFKTLAEMTTHMQQTQHYTNIISQEQIISWKSPEDRCSNQAHVNAVLTCKVCDQAFSSLKELSNHMVKNSHYKEHILRSITENGGRRRQTREKRKKSLPVRKLLELERAQNEMTKGHGEPRESSRRPGTGSLESNGRITCEKCGKKIDTQSFVEHIRLCVGGGQSVTSGSREAPKAASPSLPSAASSMAGLPMSGSSAERKSGRESGSPLKREHSTPSPSLVSHHPIPPTHPNGQMEVPEAPSVLNAIERLIEKSFESKRNRQVYVGSGSNSGTPVSASLTATSTTPTPMPHSPVAPKKSLNDVEGRRCSPAQHSKGGRRTPSSKEDRERKRDGYSDARERHRRRRQKRADKVRESDEERKRDGLEEEEDGDDEDDGADEEDKSRKEDCLSSPNSICSGGKEAALKSVHDLGVAVRLSPSTITTLKREASPARSLHSPASTCSSSSHGTVGGARGGVLNEGGGTLSLVCSSPSPTSPSCSDHPLRELQKLLDKTNVSLTKGTTSTSMVGTGAVSPSSTSAAMLLSSSAAATTTTTANSGTVLAFSWACNDTAPSDSILKCAFCDTPFISKGAYRHHLSKMHFIKDGALPELSPPAATNSSATVTTTSCGSGALKNNSLSSLVTVSSKCTLADSANVTTSPNSCKSPLKSVSSTSSQDESPHSKFLKYTELAKQLSSKYV